MIHKTLWASTAVLLTSVGLPAFAEDTFIPGPVIENYGAVADVPEALAIPEGTVFKVAYDVTQGAEEGVSRQFNTLARFLNMHVRAGVPEENLHLAAVVHGSAVFDVVKEKDGEPNPQAELITELLDHGVRIMVCGQSAAHHKLTKEDLLPGVEIALSAMTAHALLQQEGYTLNPF